MKHQTISLILEELYERRVELAASKFSGVHFVNGTYRVHIDAFIPRMFCDDETLWKDIASTVDIVYHQTMKWDQPTLWLTMKDRK